MSARSPDRSRIRRGAQPRARVVNVRRGPVRAPARRPSATRRALARLPLPYAQIKAWARRGAAIAAIAGAVALLFALHLPQLAGDWLGEEAGDAGFAVSKVETHGLVHMDPMAVNSAVFDQDSVAMPLVDLQAIRQRLLRYGWVADARVSRRLPDTLVVDIVERTPVAVWQNDGRLMLVDQAGVVLAPVNLSAMPDLPLVIGPGANTKMADLSALLAAAPQLKPMLAGATWVGGRRWDVRFQSGETLMLPEGEQAARQALRKFARMDGSMRLLGQGYVRFDMRIPGKIVVRVSREPGDVVSNAPPAAAAPSI